VDLELAGKVALVTGVSQGIGLAVANVLAVEGMRVAGTSRTAAPGRDQIAHLLPQPADTSLCKQCVSPGRATGSGRRWRSRGCRAGD
jgi:NAD(P)-dependent dehydrogenase (short-subunit alcohol dehydrogenase family)